eukprot:2070812-Pyramimonas_sp.AAC.1
MSRGLPSKGSSSQVALHVGPPHRLRSARLAGTMKWWPRSAVDRHSRWRLQVAPHARHYERHQRGDRG